ncbi:MAG: hypothetical protein AAGH76_14940 [Pseudomonadota bacterium]
MEKFERFAIPEMVVQSFLWAALAFSIVREFELDGRVALVAVLVLGVRIAIETFNSTTVLPSMIEYLGYEANEKVEALRTPKIGDHLLASCLFVACLFLLRTVLT